MSRGVVFHPDAERELRDLYDHIVGQSGARRAGKFVDEIRSYCLGFSTFPERGTRRDDIEPGVRVVGFRRRVNILFAVEPKQVLILGIYYGGRNIGSDILDDDAV